MNDDAPYADRQWQDMVLGWRTDDIVDTCPCCASPVSMLADKHGWCEMCGHELWPHSPAQLSI